MQDNNWDIDATLKYLKENGDPLKYLNIKTQIRLLERFLTDADGNAHIPPVSKGAITSLWGFRDLVADNNGNKLNPFHSGIDFAGKEGDLIKSTAEGKVITVDNHPALGLRVEVKHPNGEITSYGHNSRIVVKEGQTVRIGQIIAKMGHTGYVVGNPGTHLHYSIRSTEFFNPGVRILDQ